MSMPAWSRAVTSLACAALVIGPLPVRAEETIRCDADGFGYRYCRVDTDNRVELVRQHSLWGCKEGRSWGYDGRGVWVDHGCSADFKVGHRGMHRDTKIAGAVVGLVALAALAAHAKSANDKAAGADAGAAASGEVAAWAVGSFSGRDDTEGAEVQLTILPGGAVNGRAGSHEFTGSFRGDRLEAGRHRFRVARAGNGFIATDEVDSRHRVEFRRSGSGY